MNKLDTMNHTQRATFARAIYQRMTLRRSAATAVNAWTISKGGK